MHHNSQKNSPCTLKATLYLNFKNGGMALNTPTSNTYQQKRASHHKNISKQNIVIYHNCLSRFTLIKIQPKQNKNINHSQETFDFTFSRMQLFIRQQHQNHMLKLSLT